MESRRSGRRLRPRRGGRSRAAPLGRSTWTGRGTRPIPRGRQESAGRCIAMRKWFEYGGFAAAAVLIAFGIAALVMGINGNGTVNSSLTQEYIVGSPDMTPQAIAPEVKDI